MDTMLDLNRFYIKTLTINQNTSTFINVKSFVGLLPSSQIVFCKDLNSIIRGCNDTFAHLMGLNSGNDTLGKRITELSDTARGKELEEAERIVLESLTPVEDTRNLSLYFKRSPLYCIGTAKIMPMYNDSEKVQGVLGIGTRDPYFMNIEEIFNGINGAQINQVLQLKKYILKLPFGNIRLSKREAACLLFLMKGKSAKEIARELCISNRTVECFITHIKEKMRCNLKSEIVSLAYENNFLMTIQQNF